MQGANDKCSCDGPGFCEQHGVNKCKREFELCKGINCTRSQCSRYFNAWQLCRQRGQDCTPDGSVELISPGSLTGLVDHIPMVNRLPTPPRVVPKMSNEDLNKVDLVIQKLRDEEDINNTNVEHHDPKGLGDSVERVLTSVGITKERVEAVLGKGCGCDQRKAFLNKLWPYTKKGEE